MISSHQQQQGMTPVKAEMANQTFISYARKDQEFVLKLASELRRAGANIWVDQFDIVPGEDWDIAVENALYACESFMLILSTASVQSKDVRDELNYAISKGKRIIPVLHEPCEIPLRIHRIQYIDFTSDYNPGMGQLLKVFNLPKPTPMPQDPDFQKRIASDTLKPAKDIQTPTKSKQKKKTPEAVKKSWQRHVERIYKLTLWLILVAIGGIIGWGIGGDPRWGGGMPLGMPIGGVIGAAITWLVLRRISGQSR